MNPIYVCLLVLVLMISMLFHASKKNEKELKRMQKQLDELREGREKAAEQEAEFSEEDKAAILQLKDKGKLIGAIKETRDLTGWDLKKAKDYVDSL